MSQKERGHGDNFMLTSDELVITVQEASNSHLEFHQRDVTYGMRSPGKLLVDVHVVSRRKWRTCWLR